MVKHTKGKFPFFTGFWRCSRAETKKLIKKKYRCLENVGKSITLNFLYLSHGYVGIRLHYRSILSLSQATVLYKKKERKDCCVIAQHKVLSFKYIPRCDDG